MSVSQFVRSKFLLAALIGTSLALAPAPAHAQFFSNPFGQRHYAPPPPPNSYVPERSPFERFFGFFRDDVPSRGEEEKSASNSYGQYCVRTCDGKFFPVNRGGRKDISLDKICSAMCPAAQTKIFSGAGIDRAVASDGQKYSAIPNAFAYRAQIVDNCTCNGRDPFGVERVDLDNDPTLQKGDLVSRPDGFSIYGGTPGNYTPIEKSGMSPAFVKQFIAIKILADNPHATFAKTMPVVTSVVGTPPPEASAAIQEPDANTNAPATPQPPARTN